MEIGKVINNCGQELTIYSFFKYFKTLKPLYTLTWFCISVEHVSWMTWAVIWSHCIVTHVFTSPILFTAFIIVYQFKCLPLFDNRGLHSLFWILQITQLNYFCLKYIKHIPVSCAITIEDITIETTTVRTPVTNISKLSSRCHHHLWYTIVTSETPTVMSPSGSIATIPEQLVPSPSII